MEDELFYDRSELHDRERDLVKSHIQTNDQKDQEKSKTN